MEWRVTSLAPDFSMIDSWEIPLGLDGSVKFVEVYQFLTGINPVDSSSITRALFKVRFKIGSWFGWDDGGSWPPVPGTGEKSLKERLSQEDHGRNLDKKATNIESSAVRPRLVYLFESEALLEISNKTIYALLHYSLDENYQLRLSVFIKSRGKLSDFYMLLIKPFRHFFVYPALIKFFKKRWALRVI